MVKTDVPQVGTAGDRGQVKSAYVDQVYEGKLPWGRLLLLADGLGDTPAHAEAASVALETIQKSLETAEISRSRPETVTAALKNAMDAANQAVWASGQRLDAPKGYGASLAMGVVIKGDLYVAYSGTAIILIVRDGRPVRVTRDFSSPGDRRAKESKVPRSLGLDPTLTPAVSGAPIPLRRGDALLFCSDGLHEALNDEELCRFVIDHPADIAAIKMVELANQRGGSDNLTALVVQLGTADPADSAKLATVDVGKGGSWSLLWLLLSAAIVAGTALAVVQPWKKQGVEVPDGGNKASRVADHSRMTDAAEPSPMDAVDRGADALEVKSALDSDAAPGQPDVGAGPQRKNAPKPTLRKGTQRTPMARDKAFKAGKPGAQGKAFERGENASPHVAAAKDSASSTPSRKKELGVDLAPVSPGRPTGGEDGSREKAATPGSTGQVTPQGAPKRLLLVSEPLEEDVRVQADVVDEKAVPEAPVDSAPTGPQTEETGEAPRLAKGTCDPEQAPKAHRRNVSLLLSATEKGEAAFEKKQFAWAERSYRKAESRLNKSKHEVQELCGPRVTNLRQRLAVYYAEEAGSYARERKCKKSQGNAGKAREFGADEKLLKAVMGDCYEE